MATMLTYSWYQPQYLLPLRYWFANFSGAQIQTILNATPGLTAYQVSSWGDGLIQTTLDDLEAGRTTPVEETIARMDAVTREELASGNITIQEAVEGADITPETVAVISTEGPPGLIIGAAESIYERGVTGAAEDVGDAVIDMSEGLKKGLGIKSWWPIALAAVAVGIVWAVGTRKL